MEVETMDEPQTVNHHDLLQLVRNAQFSHPSEDTKMFKDECTYCFKTPFYRGGLFVCLSTYHCFCAGHAAKYAQKTDHNLFLHIQSKKFTDTELQPTERSTGEPNTKISKLAISDTPKIEITDDYFVVLYPYFDQKCPIGEGIGERLIEACQKVISSTSAERLALLATSSNAWDAEIKLITKHVDLIQHDNGKRVPSEGWVCEHDGCDLAENLWLNLTDGAIRCGRSQFIGENQKSRGNGHMQQHYNDTKYPLVVKLGTISRNLEAADVYSYDEQDSAIDPNLERHLAHFGIDPTKMSRTEKNIIEMELDINEKWEWTKCQEDGAELESIYGPGYTGIINLGSSCYMNSVLQALLQVGDFRRRFSDNAEAIFNSVPLNKTHTDFNAQVAKVISSLMSGEFAVAGDDEHNAIKPRQFKMVVAGSHREFSTARQQDVEEYIRFFLDKVSVYTPEEADDPTYAFRFKTENRFEDIASGQVRYTEHDEVLLHLQIPQDALEPTYTDNRYRVSMQRVLQAAFNPQTIEGYKSPVTGAEMGATTRLRFKTFPDFLIVQAQKFAYTSSGEMKKLDIDMEVEERLNLDAYRGCGIQDGEKRLPDDAVTPPKPMTAAATSAPAPAQPAAVQLPNYDRSVVDGLMSMGFSENASIKAAMAVGTGGLEAAADWVMQRLDDESINDPPQAPSTASRGQPKVVSAEDIDAVTALGFTVHQARYALQRHSQVEVAVDWLFGNSETIPDEEPPAPAVELTPKASPRKRDMRDGKASYKLVGFISHMGSKPDSGHYVAHMLKQGKWILFNDEKVAISQNPPMQLAYVYLYQRDD